MLISGEILLFCLGESIWSSAWWWFGDRQDLKVPFALLFFSSTQSFADDTCGAHVGLVELELEQIWQTR